MDKQKTPNLIMAVFLVFGSCIKFLYNLLFYDISKKISKKIEENIPFLLFLMFQSMLFALKIGGIINWSWFIVLIPLFFILLIIILVTWASLIDEKYGENIGEDNE